MSSRAVTNIAASVLSRLKNVARQQGRTFNEVLQHYAIERFLYRLSRTPYADKFVLKGALMLHARAIESMRPTMDVDLLARLPDASTSIVEAVQAGIAADVTDDGLYFDPSKIEVSEITRDADDKGVRLLIHGSIGTARVRVQVDVGVGDSIIPGPVWIDYPEILDFGQPHILMYTLESAIAEKYQTMVALEMNNSRMKDFYDLHFLCTNYSFSGITLARAIGSTFERRRTAIPVEAPVALTTAFADNDAKQKQWRAFCRNARLTDLPAAEDDRQQLLIVINSLRAFLLPPSQSLVSQQNFILHWPPGGPWQTSLEQH